MHHIPRDRLRAISSEGKPFSPGMANKQMNKEVRTIAGLRCAALYAICVTYGKPWRERCQEMHSAIRYDRRIGGSMWYTDAERRKLRLRPRRSHSAYDRVDLIPRKKNGNGPYDRLFLTARSADAFRDSTNCPRDARALWNCREQKHESRNTANKLSFPSNAPWADPDSADRSDLPFKDIRLSNDFGNALKRARRESANGRNQCNFRPRISGNTQRIQLTGITFARFSFQAFAMAPRVSLSLSARRHERRRSGTRDGVPARAMPRPVSSEETSHPLGERPRRRCCLTDAEGRGANKTEEREKWWDSTLRPTSVLRHGSASTGACDRRLASRRARRTHLVVRLGASPRSLRAIDSGARPPRKNRADLRPFSLAFSLSLPVPRSSSYLRP